jgi:hypothetical protein
VALLSIKVAVIVRLSVRMRILTSSLRVGDVAPVRATAVGGGLPGVAAGALGADGVAAGGGAAVGGAPVAAGAVVAGPPHAVAARSAAIGAATAPRLHPRNPPRRPVRVVAARLLRGLPNIV